jgi:phosphomethylpyrimidine synthase
MVEGPGHVPYDQIEYNMKLQRRWCHGAPFYVLGPLVSDMFAGYDHVTSAIGGTAAAYHGASMLCYVTPKEHLGLPRKEHVKEGCVVHKLAAHAADVALGIPASRDQDDEISAARAGLDWRRQFELAFDSDLARAMHDEDMPDDRDYCAMCGHDWCAVRLSGEVRRKSRAADAALAQGAGGGNGGAARKPSCHSDLATAEAAPPKRGKARPAAAPHAR